ncbi:MAG: hypothetical protein NBV60_08290 [Erythrobacter sp.]|nr:hypothetical protein [Erythrobacter sp.]
MLALASGAAAADKPAPGHLCGSGKNAAICFASVDRGGHLSAGDRAKLAAAAPVAIDIVSAPQFAAELAAFHASLPRRWVKENRYWRGFDPAQAAAAVRDAFAGLHIETRGGAKARWSSEFSGNLAYEGSTDKRTGERYIMLNRYRLDRPLGGLVATYVHEVAHKGGYSHRPGQTRDQKCEPPYVMGQIARKLAEPDKWASFVAGKNACRFWREAG